MDERVIREHVEVLEIVADEPGRWEMISDATWLTFKTDPYAISFIASGRVHIINWDKIRGIRYPAAVAEKPKNDQG
jgi:hypothetical protein